MNFFRYDSIMTDIGIYSAVFDMPPGNRPCNLLRFAWEEDFDAMRTSIIYTGIDGPGSSIWAGLDLPHLPPEVGVGPNPPTVESQHN